MKTNQNFGEYLGKSYVAIDAPHGESCRGCNFCPNLLRPAHPCLENGFFCFRITRIDRRRVVWVEETPEQKTTRLNLEIVRLVKRCIVLERVIVALSVALIGLIAWWTI